MADFEAIFELDDIDKIDCIFDISATVYNYEELDKLPQINGETLIGNKTSEELHLASAEELAGLSSALDFEIQARETADVNINNRIDTIVESFDNDIERLEQNIQNETTTRANNDTLLQNNINTLDEKVDGININLTAQIDNLEQDVNDKYNELIRDIDDLTGVVEEDYNTLNTKIDTTATTINQRITDVADELNQTIEENVVALQQEDTALQNQINAHSTTLTAYDTRITNNANVISQEITNRQNADDNLQEQIDTKQPAGDYATKTELTNGLVTKQDTLISGTNIKTLNNESLLGEGNIDITSAQWGNITGELSNQTDLKTALDGKQPAGDYALKPEIPTKTSELTNDSDYITTNYHDITKQDVITDLGDIRNNIATNTSNISYLDEKVRDIELFKFPNAVIIGEPTISNGQVSGFSTVSYLQFPFILNLHDKAFQIDFSFTTATNVQTQQNILDSNFGLALAIQNGKGVMAISSNGTSWDIGSATGSINIQSNTTYYARLLWNKLQYKTQLSTDGVNYIDDMVIVNTKSPYPRTMFIGGCDQLETGHAPHPFLGTINMNKASLSIMGNIIWQGMDDAGLATRADISLSNLDELGQAKFDAKQDTLTAGPGIDITNNVISNTQTSAEWGNIQGVLSNQTDLQTALNSKQATISDLETIREGASKGATALQSVPSNYVTDTQLATKQNKLTAGDNITIENDVISVADDLGFNNPFSLFDCKFADHLLNNASWLRADTFDWHSGDVYVDAYNKLVEEYNSTSEWTSETIGGYSVGYKRSTSGFKITDASSESAVLNIYNSTGIAWYYILDITNKRFKLPRTKWGFKGFRDKVGAYIGESLPNISGNTGMAVGEQNPSGAIYTSTGGHYSIVSQYSFEQYGTAFDASRSSSTYQDNAPVQERGTQMYLYFYVGETVQNANLIDAGRIAEQLTNKVDVDANNLSATGKELITGWGFPSGRAVNLSIGASGTVYTPPANGFVYVRMKATAVNQYVVIIQEDTTPRGSHESSVMWAQAATADLYAWAVVKKHEKITLNYTCTVGPLGYMRFVYAEGAE